MGQLKVIDSYSCDYLIIGCGYVDRPKLTQKIDQLIQEEKAENDGEHSFMFRWKEGRAILYQEDKDGLVEAVKKVAKNGFMRSSICIKNDGNPTLMVDELRRVGHCACWGHCPDVMATFDTKTKKLVLYHGYGTE